MRLKEEGGGEEEEEEEDGRMESWCGNETSLNFVVPL